MGGRNEIIRQKVKQVHLQYILRQACYHAQLMPKKEDMSQ